MSKPAPPREALIPEQAPPECPPPEQAPSPEQARRRAQHQRRLAFMPWLYERHARDKPHLSWVRDWQRQVQAELCELETLTLGTDCFIAPDAAIFGEPHRGVRLGDRCSVAAHAFIHGPVECGDDVSINSGVHLDGGRAGVRIGSKTRIAAGAKLYAFDHGLAAELAIADQPVSSRGIVIGEDVWIGAGAGITDGVRIGDHAVVAMGAVVTRDVEAWTIVAGVPARVIGDRRTRKPG